MLTKSAFFKGGFELLQGRLLMVKPRQSVGVRTRWERLVSTADRWGFQVSAMPSARRCLRPHSRFVSSNWCCHVLRCAWIRGFLGSRAYHRLQLSATVRGDSALGVVLHGWDPRDPTLPPHCTQHPHPVFPQDGGRSNSVNATTCFLKGHRRLFALSSGARCTARLRFQVSSCMLDPTCGVLPRYMFKHPDMMYRLLATFPPLPFLQTLVDAHESAQASRFTRFPAQISRRVLVLSSTF